MKEVAQPICRIIAGPNGAGKTTFALKYLPTAHCRHFVNADLIAAGLSPLAPEQQTIAASRLFLAEIAQHRQARRDFAFETTLAGRGYLRLILVSAFIERGKTMTRPATKEQNLLDCLTTAVAEALERKRRLGHYAVFWENSKPKLIGEDAPQTSSSVPTGTNRPRPHPEIAGKGRTPGDVP